MLRDSVLILCANPKFLRGYVRAAAQIAGAKVIALADVAGIATQDRDILDRVGVVVLDCRAALEQRCAGDDRERLLHVLRQAIHVVVLNQGANRGLCAEVRRLDIEALFEPHYLPEIELEPEFSRLQATVRTPDVWERAAPATSSTTGAVEPVAELQDASVAAVLAKVREPIHPDPHRLLNGFVTKSSEAELRETQLPELLPPPTGIEDAVSEITAFLGAAHGSGSGRLVVGEKGVGKTTLTHYAAAKHAKTNPSLLFVAVDYQWIPFFDLETQLDDLERAFLGCANVGPLEDPRELRRLVHESVQEGTWKAWDSPPLQVSNRLWHLTEDAGLAVRMFAHFRDDMRADTLVDEYHVERDELVAEATDWLASVRHDPRALLAHCLAYELERAGGRFRQFTWARLISSLVRQSRTRQSIRDAIGAHIPPELRAQWEDTHFGTTRILPGFSGPDATPEPCVTQLLADLGRRFRVVVFLDNADQRPSTQLETRLLQNGVEFLQELKSWLAFDAIACVRNVTYVSHDFYRADIEELLAWRAIQVRPPDLLSVLRRRMRRIRQSAAPVGREGWWFADFLHEWVEGMGARGSFRSILDIIVNRYPFNVRGQLDEFCRGATSAIVHRERAQSLLRRTSWAEVSPEFCLRALVWGSQPVYSEAKQRFVLNAYDNGHPNSAFNALLRPALLSWIMRRSEFVFSAAVEEFGQVGVPEREVVYALGKARDYHLIREIYEPFSEAGRASEGTWRATQWGLYFHERVMFNLAYIESIWWDVPMLAGFSVGEPDFLEWRELRGPAETFASWLRVEEDIVRSKAGDEWLDLAGTSTWQTVSVNIAFGLNRIEMAVTSRHAQRTGQTGA